MKQLRIMFPTKSIVKPLLRSDAAHAIDAAAAAVVVTAVVVAAAAASAADAAQNAADAKADVTTY